jgi:hypothetical protein
MPVAMSLIVSSLALAQEEQKPNAEGTSAKAPDYKSIESELVRIHDEDQKYREQLPEVEAKFGRNSKEIQDLWNVIKEADASNLAKVTAILDATGWLGAKQIGDRANSTLFLVIQHADPATQRKYLPMMRSAVMEGKAKASSLALLEDRVALREGRPQIYGSQIARDQTHGGNYYVRPILDPEKVDERRASMGLGPLADYVKNWNIVWDVEAHKQELPDLLAKLRPLQP